MVYRTELRLVLGTSHILILVYNRPRRPKNRAAADRDSDTGPTGTLSLAKALKRANTNRMDQTQMAKQRLRQQLRFVHHALVAQQPHTTSVAERTVKPQGAAGSGEPLVAPHVDSSAVDLRDGARDRDLPGVTRARTRTVAIRQLRATDGDACAGRSPEPLAHRAVGCGCRSEGLAGGRYAAFGGRMMWRDGWHYPMFSEEQLRECCARQAAGMLGGAGELRLVLVEEREERWGGEVYRWEGACTAQPQRTRSPARGVWYTSRTGLVLRTVSLRCAARQRSTAKVGTRGKPGTVVARSGSPWTPRSAPPAAPAPTVRVTAAR
eukprot:SAG11_NODE_2739_length_3025_cov_1.861586_4_plen_322_part_00